METLTKNADLVPGTYALEAPTGNRIDYMLKFFSKEDIVAAFERMSDFKNLFQQNNLSGLADLLTRLATPPGKKSFLVFKGNKYINVLTENIAFFHVKFESPVITCFNKEEYFVNYSLEQIQRLLPEKQFFRVNRQYLINFNAVKEVEHYFARKLLVNPAIPTKDKLIVSKERVTEFLHWLDNR
jgi:two-component system, LytTR family, response regulator LytT